MNKYLEVCLIALCQALSYALITINFRAVAHGELSYALATDALNSSLAFFVLRRIIKAENSTLQFIGFVVGSLAGTAIGMKLH